MLERVLLATLAVAALAPATASAAGDTKTVKLSVPANTEWLSTPVTLAAGESATIAATGTISYGSGDPHCQGIPITPDGCAEAAPVAGNAGALVGRVGTGAPFVVGHAATVSGPGVIALGINDWKSELGNNTGAFAVTITAPDHGTHIKGRVTDSFKEGVDNVRVIANGKGGSKQSITSDGGYFDIKLSDIKKAATYNVSASNRLYRFIDPKIHKVTVKPGGTGYAAFTVATGKLRGTVRELDCVRTSPLASTRDCRARKVATSAVVELRGDQVGKKYANVNPDGTYEFKVPTGRYDVRVNRLDTTARGGEDVCKESPRIPAKGDDEVDCDKVVKVEAKKGATKTTDFVGVPRLIVATLRLLTFDRLNRPHQTASVRSGLGDPEDPELFGSYGRGSGKDDYPVVRCKSGCATIEATARNLLGKPIKGARFVDIDATPIAPALGVTPGNDTGVACFTPRRAPDRSRRDCLRQEPVDSNGRALGLYAAPGIVPGAITQQPDGQPYTYVRTTATARGYADAPVVAGPLVITPNERVGARRTTALVLTQKQADELNLITDPNTVKQGLVNTVRGIPEACGSVTQYFLGKEGTGGKAGKARDAVSKLCDLLETPSKLAKPALEQYVDLVGATFLTSRLGIRADGLISSFGNRFDVNDIPTSASEWLNVFIPNTTTPAARFLSDYLKDWRKAQGGDHFDANGKLVREPLKAGQRVTLRMFEVSHYRLDALQGGDLVRTPAVLLSLQADFLLEPKTLIVTGREGYDPLRWLA